MKSPLISIITPSFNQAQFLESTILSVLEQDYPSIEYLIIDGGSTDGSVDIIKKYSNRLAWWVSEKDQGQADAVNKGLSRAKGKYIGWLNSDDLYQPGAVQQAIRLLETNPEVGFVFGDVESIDENGKTINVMQYDDWKLPDLMQFRIIGQPGVFLRKDIMERVGGLDLSYHYLLDHHLWLKVGLEAEILYSQKLWAAARFHAQAKNIAHASEFGKEAYRLVSWMESEPEFADYLDGIHRKMLAGADRINARYLLDGGKNRKALHAYWHGLKQDIMTVIPEWHRIVFALLSIAGLGKVKKLFYKTKYLLKRPDKKVRKISSVQNKEEK